MAENVTVLFADYAESGFARKILVPRGTTVADFLEQESVDLGELSASVMVNSRECTSDQVLEAPPGEHYVRVSLSQVNMKGA